MDETFDKAASDVMVLLQTPTHKEAGELYGLYKQVKVGDINVDRPGFLDLKGKGKWDAWNDKKGMPKEKAMEDYIELVEKLKLKYGFNS